ncbi:hypothetical protein BgiBS90_003124, partial [Biomphalaria glabrata]
MMTSIWLLLRESGTLFLLRSFTKVAHDVTCTITQWCYVMHVQSRSGGEAG